MKNLFIPTKQNNYKPYLLRKIAIVAYSLILVFVNSFGGIFGIQKAEATSITPDAIISLTNNERTALGLNALNTDSRLAAAALAKANNMLSEQYWDHFGPNGETPWQFIRAEGYNYVYAGENLAKGFQTAEGVVEAWMASPTHKANIVSVNYKDIGVAVVQGTLLGKQTILVVQMFGNLTQEVAGASTTDSKTSSSGNTVVGKDSGDIMSISITAPTEGAILTDPSSDIQGNTTNTSGDYTVQVYDNNTKVGETSAKGNSWDYDKGSDWSEGEHSVKADIKGTSTASGVVNFSVDSKAPVIDAASVAVVKQNNTYVVTFKIDSTWTDLRVINGEKTIVVTSEDKNNISVEIPVDELASKVVILASDISGNISQLDISEYFNRGDSSNPGIILSIANSTVGDKISVAIVCMVFVLLCIEVFVYWRKGKLREITGDLFTVGAWWLILTIAIFNGFTGLIN